MSALLAGFDFIIVALRGVFFAIALAVLTLCVLDWMVRTRRLNPLGALAGFLRTRLHPFIAPVESKLIRSGGNPAVAPWWTLLFVVLSAIIILELLAFARDQLAFAAGMLAGGLRGTVRLVVEWTFELLRFALIVRVLASWIRTAPFAWYVRWSYTLTEWILHPLRGVIPLVMTVDITPVVAYLLLGVVQDFLVRLL